MNSKSGKTGLGTQIFLFVSLPALALCFILAMVNYYHDFKEVQRINAHDPSTVETCTITKIGALNEQRGRGHVRYSADVESSCGPLRIEELKNDLSKKRQLVLYRDLTVGKTYEVSKDSEGVIYGLVETGSDTQDEVG